jgi:hypothetical protein
LNFFLTFYFFLSTIYLRSVKNQYFKKWCILKSINLKECEFVLSLVSRSIKISFTLILQNFVGENVKITYKPRHKPKRNHLQRKLNQKISSILNAFSFKIVIHFFVDFCNFVWLYIVLRYTLTKIWKQLMTKFKQLLY